jgi:hypothetical protein
MRSLNQVRQRILLGLGGGFAIRGGLACGGNDDHWPGETGGATSGSTGTSGTTATGGTSGGATSEGRPFVVDGTARHASAVTRADWFEQRVEGSVDCKPEERRRLAAAWLADAQAEHASIASFSRLSLHLLAVGAPPDLIADAQLAASDEIEHAKLCFGLASRYTGRSLGPGPLSMEGAVANVSLTDLAAATVREGCVGETMSAVLAGERRERARDAEVRAALERIAADETRHAELAWRTVAWAIARGGDAVRESVRLAFEAAVAPYLAYRSVGEGDDTHDELTDHGLLPHDRIRLIEKTVARDLVVPLAAAFQRERLRSVRPALPMG